MTPASNSRPGPIRYWNAVLRVFDMSLAQMLWSRRTVFMALATGAPVLIAVILRVMHEVGLSSLRINGTPVQAPVIFGRMIWLLYLRFVVPVLGAFYGTSLMSDEVEDRTLTYLFTRPVPRGAVTISGREGGSGTTPSRRSARSTAGSHSSSSRRLSARNSGFDGGW